MKLSNFLSLAALAVVSGCGGGGGGSSSSSSTASQVAAPASIAYVDPSGNGWRFVRDYTSTSTHLVLDLIGPDNLKSRGVGFNIKRGPGLKFGTFADGAYAHDTGVFELKGSNPNFAPWAGTAADPVLFVSAPLAADVLSTGIFQKDRSYTAKSLSLPVVQIAVDLAEGAQAGPGYLKVVKARMLGDDIGAMNFQLNYTDLAKAKMTDIDVTVGQITLQ